MPVYMLYRVARVDAEYKQKLHGEEDPDLPKLKFDRRQALISTKDRDCTHFLYPKKSIDWFLKQALFEPLEIKQGIPTSTQHIGPLLVDILSPNVLCDDCYLRILLSTNKLQDYCHKIKRIHPYFNRYTISPASYIPYLICKSLFLITIFLKRQSHEYFLNNPQTFFYFVESSLTIFIALVAVMQYPGVFHYDFDASKNGLLSEMTSHFGHYLGMIIGSIYNFKRK